LPHHVSERLRVARVRALTLQKKPVKQAVAIAYSEKREAGKK